MKLRLCLITASWLSAFVGLVLLLLIFSKPVSAQAEETALSKAVTNITITNNGFDPDTITIEVGSTVVWTNQTTASVRLKSGYRYQIYLPVLLRSADDSTVFISTKPAPLALLSNVWANDDIVPGRSYTYTFTAAGNYPYFLDGNSNKTGIVKVQNPVPDFTLSITPNTQTVMQGQQTVYTVTLTAINGFTTPVSLMVSNLPLGAISNWGINPLIPTDETTLSISTTANAVTGTQALTISGVAGSQTHSAQVNLTITSDTETDNIPCLVIVGQPLPPAFPPVGTGCVTGASNIKWRFNGQGGVNGFDLTIDDNGMTIYQASIDFQKAANGRIESYSGLVSGKGFPSFTLTTTNTYNPQGGLIGAMVTKSYKESGNEYKMEIIQYCPLPTFSPTGYKVRYNNEAVTVGTCS